MTVWINEWHLLNERAPFGGYKQSGIGREFGRIGVEEYMEIKHIHVKDTVRLVRVFPAAGHREQRKRKPRKTFDRQ